MKNKAFVFLLFWVSTQIFAQTNSVDLLITNASIIDVRNGNIASQKCIVVNKGEIVSVCSEAEAKKYKAKKTVNAIGKYIIPGLWDMHAHFGGGDTLIQENKDLLSLYIANGITAVREAAADITPSVLEWRKAVANGTLLGPTIFTSGPKLEGYKSIWQGDLEVGTVEEINKALDSLQKINVDFVKITDNTIKPDIYQAAIRETVKRGYKISGHIPSSVTLEQASEAGLSSIEHITYLLRAGLKNQAELTQQVINGTLTGRELSIKALNEFDEATALKTFDFLAKHKTAVVPTLSISYTTAYLDQNSHQNDSTLKYIGKGLRNTYEWRVKRAALDLKEVIAIRHETIEKAASLLPLLHRAGVTIIAGTDAGYLNSFVYPGFSLHQELEMMVKYGLTPLQALQAAIINGPVFLNKSDQYGSVESGKKADILILNQNPLINIKATQHIYALVAHGKFWDRKQLNGLLKVKE